MGHAKYDGPSSLAWQSQELRRPQLADQIDKLGAILLEQKIREMLQSIVLQRAAQLGKVVCPFMAFQKLKAWAK